jgi:hypothetical protein
MRRVLIVIGFVALLALVAGAALFWFFGDAAIRVGLEQQATAWLGQPVRIGSARAQFLPRLGLRLSDVQIANGRVSLASVDLSTGLRPLFSGRVEDAEILVSNSRVEMPLPFALLRGSGDQAAAVGTGSIQIVSVRRIGLTNIQITSRGRALTVSADSSVNGTNLALTDLRAESAGTVVRGAGTIALSPALDAQLELEADRINVDDLLALAEAFAPPPTTSGSSAASQDRLTANVSASEVTAAGLRLPQFSTTVRVQGGRVSLSPTRFLLFGGRYEGDLDMNLGRGTSLTLASRIRDLDVAQLAAFGGVPDSISGRLSGEATFSGSGDDFASVLASARGSGNATISNGAIRNLNLVRTAVLFFGRPAPATAAATDAFERIDARFRLANRILTADAFSLRSRDSDVVGAGTLAFESKALSGRADVSLSEELSAQAGTDLARYTREGNRIVLPATIAGTLGAPRLSIDAGAAVRRGLRNEVDRRLKGLIEGFRLPR